MKKLTRKDLAGLYQPGADSHKGENGRLLVIGGSKLFHAAAFWAADVASKVVDLVHFTSPAMENNELVRLKAKAKFWSGIVVPFKKVDEYIAEDDCVLIGPGMPRDDGLMKGEKPTSEIVNGLIKKYPDKKWVIDGGALQEMDRNLLGKKVIITPHAGEFERLFGVEASEQRALEMAKKNLCVVLLKGERDVVCGGKECVVVEGGNPGMTKGGTGDVLAGLVAALYCKNEALVAAKVGSYVNKKAGEALAEKTGNYFNAADLVEAVPEVLGKI